MTWSATSGGSVLMARYRAEITCFAANRPEAVVLAVALTWQVMYGADIPGTHFKSSVKGRLLMV